MARTLRILMIASEAAPFAKTGGLADVLGALPRALSRLGHTVDVVMPLYRGITAGTPVARVAVRTGGDTTHAGIHAATADGVRVLFVERPEYYDRKFLYGVGNDDYGDNPARFAFLVRAALQLASTAETPYSVVHAHDWQTGLTPVILQHEFADAPALRAVPVVFTIHNLAYQGLCDRWWMQALGLAPHLLDVDGLEYWGRLSFLKGGILFSRVVTTVSPQYAREIQTPEFGFGFDGILRSRSEDLIGILNGIDYDQWDPAHDPHLPMAYDASRLEGKTAAKQAVLAAFGLPSEGPALRRPLVAMVSRLVDQKGFDLLVQLGAELPRLDASFVLLGTGERRYEDFWRGLAAARPDRIAVRIGFDEGMAHQIEGGADVFLMPSRFEPCGLNQMYSLRYGTVPVVRATGGLADTVHDVDPVAGTGTGFTFSDYSPRALIAALQRALTAYRNAELWRRVQQAGMRQDLSWEASARRYVDVYEAIADRRTPWEPQPCGSAPAGRGAARG